MQSSVLGDLIFYPESAEKFCSKPMYWTWRCLLFNVEFAAEAILKFSVLLSGSHKALISVVANVSLWKLESFTLGPAIPSLYLLFLNKQMSNDI